MPSLLSDINFEICWSQIFSVNSSEHIKHRDVKVFLQWDNLPRPHSPWHFFCSCCFGKLEVEKKQEVPVIKERLIGQRNQEYQDHILNKCPHSREVQKSFESTDHMEDFQWTLESMQRSPAWQHLWDSQMQNTGQALVDYQTMKSLDLRFLLHQIHFLFQLNKNTSCLHKSCCTGSFIQTLCPQASQCPATNTRLTKQLIEKKNVLQRYEASMFQFTKHCYLHHVNICSWLLLHVKRKENALLVMFLSLSSMSFQVLFCKHDSCSITESIWILPGSLPAAHSWWKYFWRASFSSVLHFNLTSETNIETSKHIFI